MYPQEVKLGVGMLPSPVPILTVDDTRLPRMQLQSTLLEAPLDAGQDLLRLFLRPAVRHKPRAAIQGEHDFPVTGPNLRRSTSPRPSGLSSRETAVYYPQGGYADGCMGGVDVRGAG